MKSGPATLRLFDRSALVVLASDGLYGLPSCVNPGERLGQVGATGVSQGLHLVDGHVPLFDPLIQLPRVQASPVGQLAHGQSGLLLYETLQSQADCQGVNGFVGVPVAAAELFPFQVAHGADDSLAACQPFAGGLLVVGDGLPAQGDGASALPDGQVGHVVQDDGPVGLVLLSASADGGRLGW